MVDIGYPYYFFGSPDSVDVDVLVDHPGASSQENDSRIAQTLRDQYPGAADWNMNIIRIQDGIVVDSIPNKGSADSVNNSLFQTFKHHQQAFAFPLVRQVPRNLPLAVVKCVNASILWFKNNHGHGEYLQRLRAPLMSGTWADAVALLPTLNFENPFTDNAAVNANIYKSLAFNIGQTVALFDGVELYTKRELGAYYLELMPLLMRQAVCPHRALHGKLCELNRLIGGQAVVQKDKHLIEWDKQLINTRRCRLEA